MGLHGKLAVAVEFKAGADVFYELLMQKPQHLCEASSHVQTCHLIQGEFGHVGAIMSFTYTDDGKQKQAKEMIEAIDEEKRLLVLKVLEGDLMEEYQTLRITCQVETSADAIDLVTWTMEYEMLDDTVGHPISLLSYFINITKDMETYHSIANP